MPSIMQQIMNNVVPIRKPEGKTPSGYKMKKKSATRGEIYLYGIIGIDWFGDGVTAKQFADDLKKLGDVKNIDLRINSEGGDVFAGKTMYSLLRDHSAKVEVHVDGLAASAASFVAMAGDTINIAEGGFIMIHNAWTWARGNASDLRRTADLLESVDGTIVDVYVARTKNTAADVKKWMAEETWMTGKESVEKGFADNVVENLKVAACVEHPDKFEFRNVPHALRPKNPRVAALADRLAALRR